MITKDVIAEKTANTPMVVSFKFKQEKKDITRKKVIPFRTEKKRFSLRNKFELIT